MKELKRYENCTLSPLSSLTACDRSNKASGDIEIFKDNFLYEAVEIKLDKKITQQIVRVVQDKIYKYNPKRYYILSVLGIEEKDEEDIEKIVGQTQQKHGCNIIINGLLPTIKYYLRLVSNLCDFVSLYSKCVEKDKELQLAHKQKWQEIVKENNL